MNIREMSTSELEHLQRLIRQELATRNPALQLGLREEIFPAKPAHVAFDSKPDHVVFAYAGGLGSGKWRKG